MKPERRKYFRVKDELNVEFKELNEFELKKIKSELREEEISFERLFGSNSSVRREKNGFSAVIDLLLRIDRKLDTLLGLLQKSEDGLKCIKKGKTVDIGGSGLRFVSTEMPLDPFLELMLELPSESGQKIRILCETLRVKRLETEPSMWEVAVKFNEIREGDRDKIVSYILKKERESVSSGRPDE